MENSLNTTSSNYNSLKTFAYIVIGVYGVSIAYNAFFFIFAFLRIVFQDSFLGETGGIGSVAFGLVNLLSFTELPLRLISFILLLIWTHKAYTNLHPLKSKDLEYTPGWAVGWWFIPFANLVKPYQVMGELWNASDSDFDENTFYTNYVGTPRIIGLWWASWIISNIAGRVSEFVSDDRYGAHITSILIAVMVFTALCILSIYLTITIIQSITKEQDLRFAKLVNYNRFQSPPPPPSFAQETL